MSTAAPPLVPGSGWGDGAWDAESSQPLLRVALGPSVGHYHDALQERLGAMWVIQDLISTGRRPGRDDIVVIGTREVRSGRVEIGHIGGATSVLVGTGPSDEPLEPGADLVLDRLIDALTQLATSPEV